MSFGVSTDAMNFAMKGLYPVFSQIERWKFIAALRAVDVVFYEEAMALKRHYLKLHHADVLVMVGDYVGRFDEIWALSQFDAIIAIQANES